MILLILNPAVAKASINKEKTINCSRDAYVQQGLPDENYGKSSVFIVGCNNGDWYETYLYFNLSSIKSLNINKIELKIPIYSSPEGIVVNIYSTSTAWAETSITWNNKPSPSKSLGKVTINKHNSSITTYYKLDITSEAMGKDSLSVCLESSTTSWAIGDTKDGLITGASLKVSYEEDSNEQIGLESILIIIFSILSVIAIVIVKKWNKNEERAENKEIMDASRKALETLRQDEISLERTNKREAEKQKEKNNIEKLERMMRVSTRINLDRMQDVLDMPKKEFNNKIFEWAEEYGFTIDGNDLIVNQDGVSDFIDMLDERFTEWQEKEKNNTSKI